MEEVALGKLPATISALSLKTSKINRKFLLTISYYYLFCFPKYVYQNFMLEISTVIRQVQGKMFFNL